MFLIRRVVGESMAPMLNPNQIVLAKRWSGQARPGEVVVIRHNGLEKVKRIQKIEGERIFVVGDNQDQSTDSRDFGWLPKTVVVAKVFWPRRVVRES